MAQRTTATPGDERVQRASGPRPVQDLSARRTAAADASGMRFLERPEVRVAGAWFSVTSLQSAIEDFVRAAAARSGGGFAVRLANAYSLALAARDPGYRAVLLGPGVTLPDGAPVARAVQRKSPGPTRDGCRVRGPSFFTGVLDQGRGAGLRHYLLGASPESLAALQRSIEARFPGVVIAGVWSPPFAPLDAEFFAEAVARVRSAEADVVWLGLGTPKQDMASAVLSQRAQLPVVGVGAAFDFVAGTTREAPPLLRDHGLEWLFRLCTEPRRLWRRYLFGNAGFVRALVADELGARRRRGDLRRTSPTRA